jgi:hypothetical protein
MLLLGESKSAASTCNTTALALFFVLQIGSRNLHEFTHELNVDHPFKA